MEILECKSIPSLSLQQVFYRIGVNTVLVHFWLWYSALTRVSTTLLLILVSRIPGCLFVWKAVSWFSLSKTSCFFLCFLACTSYGPAFCVSYLNEINCFVFLLQHIIWKKAYLAFIGFNLNAVRHLIWNPDGPEPWRLVFFINREMEANFITIFILNMKLWRSCCISFQFLIYVLKCQH